MQSHVAKSVEEDRRDTTLHWKNKKRKLDREREGTSKKLISNYKKGTQTGANIQNIFFIFRVEAAVSYKANL